VLSPARQLQDEPSGRRSSRLGGPRGRRFIRAQITQPGGRCRPRSERTAPGGYYFFRVVAFTERERLPARPLVYLPRAGGRCLIGSPMPPV
jgi:hypothetical protein